MKSWIAEIVDEELLSDLYMHETGKEFIERVCTICLDKIETQKGYTPNGYGYDVIEEIEQQVIEVFRVKTYGYYNLRDFRQKHLKKRIS